METSRDAPELEEGPTTHKRPRQEESPAVEPQTPPASERRSRNPRLDGARNLLMAGYSVVTRQPTLVPEVARIVVASPRLGALPRQPSGMYKRVFLAVNDLSIFNHVAMETTREMQAKVSAKVVKGQAAERYYSKEVTSNEILAFVGLQIIFRGRANLTSIEKQFQDLPSWLPKWPMSARRYAAISASLTCDLPEFARLLRESWKNAIDPGNQFCVDETMYGFFSEKDDSSPQRFIPRKPAKNGLLSYMAGFKTRKGPFLFDLEPDFQVQALNSRSALERIVERWKWQMVPHIVVDAGFSGETTQLIVGDMGARLTSSINVGHFSLVYGQLKLHCPIGSWLAVQDSRGAIFSLHRSGSGDKEHFLCTTAFVHEQGRKEEKLMGEEQTRALASIGVRALAILARSAGVPIENDPYMQASKIAAWINEKARTSGLRQPPRSPSSSASSSSSSPSASSSSPPSAPSSSSLSRQGANEMAEQEDYSALGLPALKQKVAELGLRAAGTRKQDYLDALEQARRTSHDKVSALLRDLEKSSSESASLHHEKYKELFNVIDLHDRSLADLQNHHHVNSWRAKFTLSLLQSAIVNAWVVQKHFEDVELLPYYEALARQLLE